MRPRLARTSLAALVLALTACGSPPEGAPRDLEIPPDTAPSDVVLQTYLEALVAGDCTTARELATATFRKGNGELCGSVQVFAYEVNGAPATPSPTEVVYGTTLRTAGSADGSIPSGETMWFYDLVRQADGAWRLVGGGTGP